MMEYYIVEFIMDNNNYYSIWISDEMDFFVAVENHILLWSDILELKKYANEKNISLENDNITTYNIDYILEVISEKSTIDCKKILDFWNICSDVAHTCKIPFVGDEKKNNYLYNKLFYGTNLKTINKSTNIFNPEFSRLEINALKNVLLNCIEIICAQIIL